MNANVHKPPIAAEMTQAQALLRRSSAGLCDFVTLAQPLRDALQTVQALGNVATIKSAAKLLRRLDQFEPSVTMIGQIKSGKTTLVNSLIGRPYLLPADVNPWTSVVTSLHLCPRALTPPTQAQFRFFDDREWDRLITGGGRIGELAQRAGADDEVSKIKEQIIQMREKSKARLGRKFEVLLGSEHNYGYFDQELVERYVCLGDDIADQTTATKSQGRFADITKSADLLMQQAGYPINLCFRDTPGVNDTFLIREQITIKSIRDSRICVVVLSAHQALSATDLGLIRLISQAKSRQVLIFVNRIDELQDPANQVGEIRDSIRATLKKHNCPVDADIIFGSGLWAEHAIAGSLHSLPKASHASLYKWATHKGLTQGHSESEFMWDLSGIPDLLDAVSERIVEGEGQDLMRDLSAEAETLLTSIKVSDNLDEKASIGEAKLRMPEDTVIARLDKIAADAQQALTTALDDLQTAFGHRLERSHQTFVTRATQTLAKHLEIYGEEGAWSYDPAGFRIMLNSAYAIFGSKCQAAYKTAARDAATAYKALFEQALNLSPDLFDPRIPPASYVPPPVSLGQTIALDLRGSWWKSWWGRRQDFETQAQRYANLIHSETINLVSDLRDDQAADLHKSMFAQLCAFTTAQNEGFRNMLGNGQTTPDVGRLFDVAQLTARAEQLDAALALLEGGADAE